MTIVPAILMIVFMAMGFAITAIKNGETRPVYNIGSWFVSAIINLSILYWGGFFDSLMK